MSYEKVKSVKIKSDNEIILESCSNNVYPKEYHTWTFDKGIRKFIQYVCGNVFQITPSANNYFWTTVHTMFREKLESVNINENAIYYITDEAKLSEIENMYKDTMKYCEKHKKEKYYLKNDSYYMSNYVSGGKYYLTEAKEDAKKFSFCAAYNIANTKGWTMEKA